MTRLLLLAAVVLAILAPSAGAQPDSAGPDVSCELTTDWLDEACFTPLAAGTVLCGVEAVRLGSDVFELRLVCRRVA